MNFQSTYEFYFCCCLEPIDFENTASSTCKPKLKYCEFPFTYKNQTYHSCLKRDEVYWCPTKVDENNEAIDGFWGECDINVGQAECGVEGNINFVNNNFITSTLFLQCRVFYNVKNTTEFFT